MGVPLDPKHNHRISLEAAAELTRKYRDGGDHRKGDSTAFNQPQVIELLTQPGCVGMRIYRGMTADGESATVLVGVDKDGNDMVNGVLLEIGMPCPPWCTDDNSLTR